jgi:hypothetical protein
MPTLTAQYLNIAERARGEVTRLASLLDFTTTEGELVDPDIILNSPNVSLYSFDDATRRAIFTELPMTADLSSAPFVYQMQFDQALRLIAVSYETFLQLADKLPQAEHPILIFNSGRSGSTLTSHVFNAVEGALSLSEPDTMTQFIFLRHPDRSNEAEMRALLDGAIRMLFKPTPFITPTHWVVKFRNQTTQLMDFYQATFPGAKNLYVYRDGIGFVTSFYRLLKSAGLPEKLSISDYRALFEGMVNFDPLPLLAYLDPGAEYLSLVEQITLMWISVMELYLEQCAKGVPALAVRYSDLNSKPEQTVSGILEYCGLPAVQAEKMLAAFEKDAQAGTTLARENPAEGNKLRLSDEERVTVQRIVARHPVIKTPDFVAPGTLMV